MCDAVIESMLPCPLFITVRWTSFIYFSFFFYLNSLPFTVSVITVLLKMLGYLIKSIALNRPVCFVSLVQCPFSELISPARVKRAASGSRCSVVY